MERESEPARVATAGSHQPKNNQKPYRHFTMKHVPHTKKGRLRRGFTLIELLVVIAVIGTMSAIALPMIGNVNNAAGTAGAKAQAQHIATVFNAGRTAGVPTFAEAGSVPAALDAVGVGGSGQGALNGTTFIVAGASGVMDQGKPTDAEKVSHYLAWHEGALAYLPAGPPASNLP